MNAFFSSIKPSLQQLLNSFITDRINTGNRITDNAIIVLINTLVAFVCGFIYVYISNIRWKQLFKKTSLTPKEKKKKNGEEEEDEQEEEEEECLNTADILQEYEIAENDIEKYAFAFQIVNSEIEDYLLSTCKHKPCSPNKTPGSAILMDLDGNIQQSSLRTSILVLRQYTNPDTTMQEFIFYYKSFIYSNNANQLKAYLATIRDGDKEGGRNGHSKKGGSERDGKDIKLEIFNVQASCATSHRLIPIAKLSTRITFDTVYFSLKPNLLASIDKFLQKKMYPPELGSSNKLGIFLYGPPGTGKTKTVSAIANLLKRNIVNINLATFYDSTQESFLKLIQDNTNTAVFVFDEMDHLLERASPKYKDDYSESDEKNYLADIDLTTLTPAERIKKMADLKAIYRSRNVIDEAFLLRFLDGIGDDDNRVIIGCTNHPDKIDPTYLRPGRFDIRLKLSFCTHDIVHDILAIKFPQDAFTFEELENIVNKNITPATLIQFMVEAETPVQLLDKFKLLQKRPDYTKHID